MRVFKLFAISATLFLALFVVKGVQAGVIAELTDIDAGELKAIGVELPEGGEFKIEAVGIRAKWSDDDLLAYAWIIDSKTRQLVWRMRERETERVRSGKPLRSQEEAITLSAGKYEIYYYSFDQNTNIIIRNGKRDYTFNFDFDESDSDFDDDDKATSGNKRSRYNRDDDDDYDDEDNDDYKGLFKQFGNLFKGNRFSSRELRRYLDDCYVRLSSDNVSASQVKTFKVTGDLPGALLRKNRLGDSEFVKWGFTLDKPMSLHIYSVFEHPRGDRQAVDYGWIVNADTRERAWEISRWDTDRAGGSRKNRMFDGEVELKAGNYVLHFVTDDSHSFERFNAAPPYDPMNWGITVLPGKDFDRSAFHEYEPPSRGNALIDFSRARDDDSFEQAFRLKKKMALQVYALGEYSGGEFADYGWIENISTHRTVWEMKRRNTEYAGGGRKNRMFDGTIKLPAGDYVAYYITDGSHAYRDWNTSPPFDPSAWGMTISALKGEDVSVFEKISLTDITEGSDVLVSLTKVRDNQRRRAKFTLDKRSTVHIYAIGEGTGRDMADYAWIINDETGRDVWEMKYRDTRHAGGAKKNRVIDEEIELDAGTYVVYYVTDDSHAFNDWNASRPRDFRHWGVTISLDDR